MVESIQKWAFDWTFQNKAVMLYKNVEHRISGVTAGWLRGVTEPDQEKEGGS